MEVQHPRLERILRLARIAAKEGRIDDTHGYLEKAGKYAAKVGIEVPEATLQEVKHTAYISGLEVALYHVIGDADGGLVDLALDDLRKARKYAAELGVELSETRLQEVEQTAYINRVKATLESARIVAMEGRIDSAHYYLEEARVYAAELGLVISAAIFREVEQTAHYYKNLNQELMDMIQRLH
ncbi:MAG: hypothetical protein HZB66_03520 [Candidatus Aenigmarchaeota archaeon]|nr:hypothetical protein [Candidatus Aenigmarchaeota archaeon]